MNSKFSRGYIAILFLFIGIIIIIFLMVQQYTNIASKGDPKNQNIESDQNLVSPIDRAQNARDMLEERDRGLFNN